MGWSLNRYRLHIPRVPNYELCWAFKVGDKVTAAKDYLKHYGHYVPDGTVRGTVIYVRDNSRSEENDQYDVEWENWEGDGNGKSWGLWWHLEPWHE